MNFERWYKKNEEGLKGVLLFIYVFIVIGSFASGCYSGILLISGVHNTDLAYNMANDQIDKGSDDKYRTSLDLTILGTKQVINAYWIAIGSTFLLMYSMIVIISFYLERK